MTHCRSALDALSSDELGRNFQYMRSYQINFNLKELTAGGWFMRDDQTEWTRIVLVRKNDIDDVYINGSRFIPSFGKMYNQLVELAILSTCMPESFLLEQAVERVLSEVYTQYLHGRLEPA